jgi:hypothetical protein
VACATASSARVVLATVPHVAAMGQQQQMTARRRRLHAPAPATPSPAAAPGRGDQNLRDRQLRDRQLRARGGLEGRRVGEARRGQADDGVCSCSATHMRSGASKTFKSCSSSIYPHLLHT